MDITSTSHSNIQSKATTPVIESKIDLHELESKARLPFVDSKLSREKQAFLYMSKINAARIFGNRI